MEGPSKTTKPKHISIPDSPTSRQQPVQVQVRPTAPHYAFQPVSQAQFGVAGPLPPVSSCRPGQGLPSDSELNDVLASLESSSPYAQRLPPAE